MPRYLYYPSNESFLYSTRIFLGNPKSTLSFSEEDLYAGAKIDGWYYSKNFPKSWIELACKVDWQSSSINIDRRESPDLVTHFKDPGALRNRFSISISSSLLKHCAIDVKEKAPQLKLGLLDISASTQYDSADKRGILYIQNVLIGDPVAPYKKLLSIRGKLFALYKVALPTLTMIGFASFLMGIILMLRKKKMPSEMLYVAIASWVLYISRVCLLAIVETTSFPVMGESYLSAAFILPTLASVVSLAMLINLYKSKSYE